MNYDEIKTQDNVYRDWGDDIHGEAIGRFDADYPYLQEERVTAISDRRFAFIAGAQWEGDWADIFTNAVQIEVNKTAQGLTDIYNAYQDHRIVVNYRSVGTSTKDDAASTLNGMYLADYYLSGGDQAQDNAFFEGVAGGYGAWRLTNVYCDDEDEEEAYQKIIWETIVDADQNVFWDRNARLYDKSDAKYCYVISPYSPEAFKAEFGEDAIASWPQQFLKPYYDWYQPLCIRVCEYYKLVEVKDTVWSYVHTLTGNKVKVYKSDKDYQDDRTKLEQTGYELRFKKNITRTECRKWIMSGLEILGDDYDHKKGKLIAGGVIPVVPFYGQRFFIDNQERAKGHVRSAKDPQRVYNVQISKLVEQAALSPREVPIFTPEQMQGHEDSWANMNQERHPYALINPITDEAQGGLKVNAGPVSYIKPPDLPPVLGTLIQISANDIQELTNSQDGAGSVKANVSADAMDIAATRTDAKADMYLANMTRSVIRAGQIYQAMAADIYFDDDREVPVASFGKDQKIQFDTAKINSREADEAGNQVIKNQIGKGQFNVIADVSEQTKTRRDKTVKALYNMLQFVMPADPELGTAIAGTMITNLDGDGITDLQSYVRQQMLLKGVIEPNDEEKQMLAQLQQKQAQQPPSPQDQLLMAETANLQAAAVKNQAQTQESQTKALVNQANASKIQAETGHTNVLSLKELHTPMEIPQANQTPVTQTPPKKQSWLSRFANLGRK